MSYFCDLIADVILIVRLVTIGICFTSHIVENIILFTNGGFASTYLWVDSFGNTIEMVILKIGGIAKVIRGRCSIAHEVILMRSHKCHAIFMMLSLFG